MATALRRNHFLRAAAAWVHALYVRAAADLAAHQVTRTTDLAAFTRLSASIRGHAANLVGLSAATILAVLAAVGSRDLLTFALAAVVVRPLARNIAAADLVPFQADSPVLAAVPGDAADVFVLTVELVGAADVVLVAVPAVRATFPAVGAGPGVRAAFAMEAGLTLGAAEIAVLVLAMARGPTAFAVNDVLVGAAFVVIVTFFAQRAARGVAFAGSPRRRAAGLIRQARSVVAAAVPSAADGRGALAASRAAGPPAGRSGPRNRRAARRRDSRSR